MAKRTAFIVLCSFLAWAQLSHGAAEGKLSRDGFTKIVSGIEDENARSFFEELAPGSSYAFPVVWDLAELTAEDLWMRVDGVETAVTKDQLSAFLRAMAAAGVTMTAEGKSVRYELREGTAAGEGSSRKVVQTEPKSNGAPKKRKAGKKTREEAAAPVYRLKCPYGDVVLSAEDAGEIYPDYEVAGIVDKLTFKDFPYNRDGDAQKLFRECQKKMEGLMSSTSGRKGVLRTYAYYDTEGQSWKADLLEKILDYYDWGKIAKE